MAPIISIGECEKAITMSNKMVQEWLLMGMFAGEQDAGDKAKKILEELGSHDATLNHSRHISMKQSAEIGLKD